MKEELKEGWKYLANSPKYHYFREGQSLCRRWMTFGSDFQPDEFESSQDCKACRKKLNKEKPIIN